MAIAEMSLVKISGNVKDINDTFVKCCKFGMFHPERAAMFEEYEKNNEKYLEYSNNTGYLRKIVDLAGKLGLGLFKNKIPELQKYDNDDKVKNKDLKISNKENEMELIAYDNPYKTYLNECEAIFSKLRIEAKEEDYSDIDMSLDSMSKYIKDLRSKVEYLIEEKFKHEKKISEYSSVLTQLENIGFSDINFDELFSCKYFKIRFGRLPIEGYEKLKIFDNENFIFLPFKVDTNYNWCSYIVPCYYSKKVDDLFKSLFFEGIRIPIYAHGTPETTIYYVKDQIDNYEKMLKYIDHEIKSLQLKVKKELFKIYSKIKFFNECFDNKKYAAIFEDQFYIIGFIPKKQEHHFINQFENLEDIDITISNPNSENRIKTPVKLKNNKFYEPFESFVSMYGLPSYNDIDPTIFLSISYTLLFGIMFGDIGQGLVIALIGSILWRLKNISFGRILTRIGLSSSFFGIIYGSCFGIEDIFKNNISFLPNPYKDILLNISHKEPNTVLLAAIGIGIIFIICSMIFNIRVGLKQKKSAIYLFGQNGLAGLMFYISVILAIVIKIIFKNVINPWFIICFIVLPLIFVFFKEPLGDKIDGHKIKFHEGVGGFIIENFFEMYDILLGFMSNTLSFIRVGAFVLSHAGMMSVIIGFTEKMSGNSKIAVLIFGNIFVIAFEGLIVGIQALRLQFYEMFSRCFDGSGKPFKHI